MKTRLQKQLGFTITETLVALGILGAALATLAFAVVTTQRQRRVGDQRQFALQEAANVLERLATKPWNELATERLGNFEPSEELLRVSPAARVRVRVEELADEPRGKKITATVTWPIGLRGSDSSDAEDDTARLEQTLDLVAYRFQAGGQP